MQTAFLIAIGISQTVSLLIALTHYVLKKGRLRIQKYKPQMKLLGADAQTLEFTAAHMWKYC